MFAQRRLRSAWASTQSDQSLRCVLNVELKTQCFFIRTVTTLIRLGGCPGLSESSLGEHSFYWFCYVVAQIFPISNIALNPNFFYDNLPKNSYMYSGGGFGPLTAIPGSITTTSIPDIPLVKCPLFQNMGLNSTLSFRNQCKKHVAFH